VVVRPLFWPRGRHIETHKPPHRQPRVSPQNLAASFAQRFGAALRARLLHAGAATGDIIATYVSTIRALHTVDPSGEGVGKCMCVVSVSACLRVKCVCMCAYMCLCACACARVCVCVCVCARARACVCVCVCARGCVRVCGWCGCLGVQSRRLLVLWTPCGPAAAAHKAHAVAAATCATSGAGHQPP
jgi:hypothetical protein